MDVILFQRINGGWEYRYTSDSETYQGFDIDPFKARFRLLRQLGWDKWRFPAFLTLQHKAPRVGAF